MPSSPAFARIRRDVLRLLDAIPAGRVVDAASLGERIDVPARHIAYIVSQLDEAALSQHPWHRLVAADGRLAAVPKALRSSATMAHPAAARLESEGVRVSQGWVSLAEVGVSALALRANLEATHRPPEHRRDASGESLSELRGLGPRSVAMLTQLGISSPQALRQQDPFAVFARLRAQHPRVSLNLLYALIGAIENRDWREVAQNDRTSVLMRLEDMGLLR